MKKAYITIITLILVLTGCSANANQDAIEEKTNASAKNNAQTELVNEQETSEEIIAEEDESVAFGEEYALTKNVMVNDGMVSFYVPDNFEDFEKEPGQIYRGGGSFVGQDGEDYWCTISVVAVAKNEDSMRKEDFPVFAQSNSTYTHGQNTVFEMLDESFSLKNYEGVLATIRYPSGMNVYHEYFTYLESDNMLYDISFTLDFNLSLDDSEDHYEDVLCEEILETFSFDEAIEAEVNNSIAFNIEDNVYYSEAVEGASIPIPDNWLPANGAKFIFNNLFISIMPQDGSVGQVTVRQYEKSRYSMDKSMKSFLAIDLVEMANRGEIDMEDEASENYMIYESSITSRLEMFAYYNVVCIFKSYVEDEDYFYTVQYLTIARDAEEFDKVTDLWETYFCKFDAPGA